jgi:hypothetical protein
MFGECSEPEWAMRLVDPTLNGRSDFEWSIRLRIVEATFRMGDENRENITWFSHFGDFFWGKSGASGLVYIIYFKVY